MAWPLIDRTLKATVRISPLPRFVRLLDLEGENDVRSLCPNDKSPSSLQTLTISSHWQRWLRTCPCAPLSPHRTFFSPDNRATCGVKTRIPKADIWHLRSCAHASSRSITDLHTISAHATGSQVSEMFSTWSATDALSTAASSDSPAAKRRRISESTHGRRTSKATRACDVCKVKTSLFVVPHCDLLSALAVPDVAHVADGYHHHVCASHMPYLL